MVGEYNVRIGFGSIMLAPMIGKVRVRLGNMLWFLQLVLFEFVQVMCGVKSEKVRFVEGE